MKNNKNKAIDFPRKVPSFSFTRPIINSVSSPACAALFLKNSSRTFRDVEEQTPRCRCGVGSTRRRRRRKRAWNLLFRSSRTWGANSFDFGFLGLRVREKKKFFAFDFLFQSNSEASSLCRNEISFLELDIITDGVRSSFEVRMKKIIFFKLIFFRSHNDVGPNLFCKFHQASAAFQINFIEKKGRNKLPHLIRDFLFFHVGAGEFLINPRINTSWIVAVYAARFYSARGRHSTGFWIRESFVLLFFRLPTHSISVLDSPLFYHRGVSVFREWRFVRYE